MDQDYGHLQTGVTGWQPWCFQPGPGRYMRWGLVDARASFRTRARADLIGVCCLFAHAGWTVPAGSHAESPPHRVKLCSSCCAAAPPSAVRAQDYAYAGEVSDSDSTVVVCGTTLGTMPGAAGDSQTGTNSNGRGGTGCAGWVTKLSATGGIVWTRHFTGPGCDEVKACAVHPITGDIVVGGYAGAAISGQSWPHRCTACACLSTPPRSLGSSRRPRLTTPRYHCFPPLSGQTHSGHEDAILRVYSRTGAVLFTSQFDAPGSTYVSLEFLCRDWSSCRVGASRTPGIFMRSAPDLCLPRRADVVLALAWSRDSFIAAGSTRGGTFEGQTAHGGGTAAPCTAAENHCDGGVTNKDVFVQRYRDTRITQPPTAGPTNTPSKNPTKNPTTTPSKNPTKNPTTSEPSKNPTTADPTASPTANPTTANPTANPTADPTANPTMNPTKDPTASPASPASPAGDGAGSDGAGQSAAGGESGGGAGVIIIIGVVVGVLVVGVLVCVVLKKRKGEGSAGKSIALTVQAPHACIPVERVPGLSVPNTHAAMCCFGPWRTVGGTSRAQANPVYGGDQNDGFGFASASGDGYLEVAAPRS